LVRNLYYFRGKASKIQHSSVFHTPRQSLMHLSNTNDTRCKHTKLMVHIAIGHNSWYYNRIIHVYRWRTSGGL